MCSAKKSSIGHGEFLIPFHGLILPTFVHRPLAFSPDNLINSSQGVLNVAFTVVS